MQVSSQQPVFYSVTFTVQRMQMSKLSNNSCQEFPVYLFPKCFLDNLQQKFSSLFCYVSVETYLKVSIDLHKKQNKKQFDA